MADLNALDASTFLDGDLDPTFAPITGRRAIAERVARRWLTFPGTVAHAPDDGVMILAWLSRGATDGDLRQLAADLEAEALKDEGVHNADVSVTLNAQTMVMTISAQLEDADGTFSMTLAIDQVSVSLLLPEAA